MKTTLLTVEDIRRIVKSVGIHALMKEMIGVLETCFRDYDPSVNEIPARSGFSYAEPNPGLLEWMPILTRSETATIKVVGYHPHNPNLHELPTIISTVSVYDVQTGQLTGLLDGVFLTALRTGAASALASLYLASPDSRVVGLIGAGAQAITQLHALATVFDLERVLVFDVDPAISRSFAHRARFLNLPIEFVNADARDRLVAEVDILCTATSTPVDAEPVLCDTETQPWLHINAIGSDFPGKTELPRSLLQRAFVCPDFPQQALVEGESQQLRPEQVGPPLYEIIQKPELYSHHRQTLTVFDSTGWALEDAAAAQLLLNYARQLGLGEEVYLQHAPADPHNPYDFVS